MTPAVSVLVVSPGVPVWGAQLFLLDQVAALRDRGIELTLASPAGSPFADEWERRGWPLLDTPIELHDGLRLAGSERRPGAMSLLRTALGVARGISTLAGTAKGFDVLFSFNMRSHIEVAAAGRLTGTPVALDLVDIVRPGLGRRALVGAAKLATLTIANSHATADVVRGQADVRVVQPGIDLDRFQPGPADPALREELSGGVDRPLVAIVGRIDPLKGVHILVEAMTRLRGDAAKARLVVVGSAGTGGQEYAEQVERAAGARLGDGVLFAGRRSDVPAILRTVDVLVNASAAEPFGLSALEAQATGTPVVGTDAGGLVEFVEHEVTGLLVPPFEPEPLARAIERVLEDRELTEALTAEAMRRVRPARGLEAQQDELASIFTEVAAKGRRHRG